MVAMGSTCGIPVVNADGAVVLAINTSADGVVMEAIVATGGGRAVTVLALQCA